MLYFDNAATTFPKPKIVLDSVKSAILYYGGNPGRSGHDMAMCVSEKIYSVRKKVADFFNSEIENVIFTQNCTMSLNMAIKGILEDGDHVICSCLEHNSAVRPIYKLAEDNKITYDIAQVYDDDEHTIESFKSLIKGNTKAIICTHGSNVTGHIMPIQEIGKLCKEKGILFIVDGAQSAGILPIDVIKYNINALCLPGHKGLYGITGSGILIINGIEHLNTIIEGGTGSMSLEHSQPSFLPDRLEAGTLNTAGILSIGAGIDFINAHTMDKIYNHEFLICRHVYDCLSEMTGIKLYSSDYIRGKKLPIVPFNVIGKYSEIVVSELNKKGCALRGGLHCAPLTHEHYQTLESGMVRFAPSIFTKYCEVGSFVKNVKIISGN